jgi:hypothetical protein
MAPATDIEGKVIGPRPDSRPLPPVAMPGPVMPGSDKIVHGARSAPTFSQDAFDRTLQTRH